MEVVVVNALRARDQVGVLASATTAGILATDGHVVAKLVWDLVVSTAAVFVLRVAKIGAARDLCVRVSPLLLGIVGEIQDGEYCCVVLPDDARYMLKRKYECTGWERVVLYTGARPAATEPDKRIRGYGGGGVDEGGGGGVLLCQKPVWFKTECEVVTPKWIALFGGRDDGGWPIGREKFLLLHRWGDRLSSEFVHCGIPLTIFADGVLAILAFNSTRFDDNQLLLVLNKSDELGPHLHIINIIDAEQTHVTGKLCIVSTTMFSFPALRIQNLFVMRKNSGTRSFFCTGVSDPGMRFVRFSVAEVSGCVTQLAQPFTQAPSFTNNYPVTSDTAAGDGAVARHREGAAREVHVSRQHSVDHLDLHDAAPRRVPHAPLVERADAQPLWVGPVAAVVRAARRPRAVRVVGCPVLAHGPEVHLHDGHRDGGALVPVGGDAPGHVESGQVDAWAKAALAAWEHPVGCYA
ncbi:hypothetical protein Pelo_15620 [Pelomyxa schiedti]|nr:hypothetical protein Pelo_15620 [Pelomyxa schiedti]